MKKKTGVMVISLIAVGTISIAGSSSAFAQEDYRKIVEDYKTLFLLLDQVNYQYDCALETLGECIDGKISLSEAEEKLNDTLSIVMEEKEKNHYYCKLDEEQIVLLEKYEIDAEEYETFGNSIEDEYICIICNLAELADDLYYAKESGPEYENLVSDQEKYKELQELRKGYHYYKNFNYWFADWNEEMTDYVQTQISPELKSFVSKDFVWEKDKDTAERKAMSYMDNYEAGIQQLSENKKAEEEKNSEENTKEQKNIFETDEFSFEIPDSWVNGYFSGTGGDTEAFYFSFSDRNISYKSDGEFMRLILTRNEEFEKEEGFEYTKLDGETVLGRSIYMAVNTKHSEMDPEDRKFEQEYLEKRSDCDKIPSTLKLKTDFSCRKIENDDYSFYLPKEWEGNVIMIPRKGKTCMSYDFYHKKSLSSGGGLLLSIVPSKSGERPGNLDGARVLGEEKNRQIMYWIGGPTGVTYGAEMEDYFKMKFAATTIMATFQIKN